MARAGLLALCFALAGVAFAQQPNLAPAPDSAGPHPGASREGAAPAQDASGISASGAATSADPRAAARGGGVVSRWFGMQVATIDFRGISLDAKQRDYLTTLIAQHVNEPLDRTKIRRSLQALYATGNFSDLQVEASPGPQNDVQLIFNARENYFLGSITVDGQPKRPTASQLVNASKLQLGELYARDKVEAAQRNLLVALADNGYYRAQVTAREHFQPDTQQVDVHFHIEPDGPAHIGTVTIKGKPGYSPQEIEHMADFSPGHTVTAARVTKGLQKLRKKYQKKSRLEAQVAIAERNYRPQNNTVDYVFNIDQGPSVDLHLEGMRISRGKLKKLVPVYEEGSVDDDLLNEGLRNLRDYFQTQGHFDVKVSWNRQYVPAENHVHVIYSVDPGRKHTLEGIRIEGNRSFRTDLVRDVMHVRPASTLLPQGLYSESMLSNDMKSIERMYRDNGFLQAKVEREVDDDYRGHSGHMLIVLRISEGPRTLVGRVTVEGNLAFDNDTLLAKLSSIPGQPFGENNAATDRATLLNLYFNTGFPEVQVQSHVSPDPQVTNRMNVAFTIAEGKQVFADRVLVSGLHYTRPYVVRRELQVQPDTPLSQLGMLQSQQNLYNLGLFNEVDVAVQNPTGDARYKNVLFQLSEARRWTFTYGLGFEVQTGGQPANVSQINTAPAPGVKVPPNTTPPTGGIQLGTNPQGGSSFSPSVSFEVARLNFRGRDHTVTFKTHLGNLQKRALLNYEAPHFWDRNNLRLAFSGLFDNSRDVRTFTSERLEGAVQLQQVLTYRADGITPISSLLYRYSYRRVKVDPLSLAISPELVPLLSKPVRLGLPSFTYVRDKRDNPTETTKGNYTSFDFAISSHTFGSASVSGGVISGEPNATAANFTRVLAQNSTYQPVPFIKGAVFARSTRIGVENVYGSNASNLAIPLPERFFAGGAQSIRSFALNQAGPRDLTTGFPLGGNALFTNNLELRFPPPVLPFVGSNLSFVLFHDAGNVFQTGQQMFHSFGRWQQPGHGLCTTEATHETCRFDYMSQALGTGIRYRTPIGPVRLDLSYSPNPPSFPFFVQCPSTPVTTQPCAGLAPNALVFQHATLRHFNYFFSIGQSF